MTADETTGNPEEIQPEEEKKPQSGDQRPHSTEVKIPPEEEKPQAEEEPPLTEEKILPSEVQKEQPTRPWVLFRYVQWIGLILILLLVFAYIGLHVWVRFWFNSQLTHKDTPWINRETYRSTQNFWNLTIRFPDEWKTKPERSHAIDGDIAYLQQQLKQIDPQRLYVTQSASDEWKSIVKGNVSPLSNEDRQKLQSHLDRYAPILKASKPMISILKQELLSVSPEAALPIFYDEYYSLNELQNIILFQSILLRNGNQYREAVDLQLFSLPLYAIDPLPNYSAYGWKNYQLQEFLPEIQANLVNVWDKEPLESWLKTLNQWEPYLFRLKKEYTDFYQLFSALAEACIPIDFGNNTKAFVYIRQLKNRKFPPIGTRKVLSAVWNDWFVGTSREKSEWQPLKIELIRPWILTDDIENYYMLRTFDPDANISIGQEQITGNLYDRLRLAIAVRLYFLEKKKYPASGADLVPAYFSAEIKDRKTVEPYRWDPNGELVPKKP